MEDSTVERRRFLEIATGASMLAGVPSDMRAGDVKGQFPQRRLGHTGEMVSMVGLGGYHLARPNVEEAESIRIVRYGTDPKNLNQTAKSPIRLNPDHPSTLFRVRMDDLKPRTTYYYTVGSMEANDTSDGVKSPVHRFTTGVR